MEAKIKAKAKAKVKMKTRNKWIIAVTILLIIILILCQGITVFFYSVSFNLRFSSEGSKWITPYDTFDNLSRERVTYPSNKGQILCGYFYSQKDFDDYKGLVVVNHGFGGGGHDYYLTQIDYLAEHGYLVFAFDKTGTDESEGKYVKGLPQGIIDLEYTLDFLSKREIGKGLPVMLYGHSWGGYSVCSVLSARDDVTAAVSLSGFNQSQDMLIEQGIQIYGNFVELLTPFMKLWDFALFGKYAASNSVDGLSKTDADVLLFHSEDDPVISIEGSFDVYQEKLSDRENLRFVRLHDKGHAVFELDGTMGVADKNVDNQFGLDNSIMNQIIEFYDEASQKYYIANK